MESLNHIKNFNKELRGIEGIITLKSLQKTKYRCLCCIRLVLSLDFLFLREKNTQETDSISEAKQVMRL